MLIKNFKQINFDIYNFFKRKINLIKLQILNQGIYKLLRIYINVKFNINKNYSLSKIKLKINEQYKQDKILIN